MGKTVSKEALFIKEIKSILRKRGIGVEKKDLLKFFCFKEGRYSHLLALVEDFLNDQSDNQGESKNLSDLSDNQGKSKNLSETRDKDDSPESRTLSLIEEKISEKI